MSNMRNVLDLTGRFKLGKLLGMADAANDEKKSLPENASAERGESTGGWDPFEVWRTRVRNARRKSDFPGQD